eukprot:gene1680-2024_t
MPPWTTVEADVDVVCNLHQRLSDVYPVQNIDVVVVGIFHQGFPAAIAALAAVSALLPIKVRWVCQVAPTAAHIPHLAAADLDLETVVSPGQAELPGLYRGHDVFLFTSRYEAWGMPVLEAMATGLPVVTTDCFGTRTFCQHGHNSLVAEPDDVTGIAQHVLTVLTNPDLQARLSEAAKAHQECLVGVVLGPLVAAGSLVAGHVQLLSRVVKEVPGLQP